MIMKKQPYDFVEWIKHAYDFPSDLSIITQDNNGLLYITVHIAQPKITLNLNEDIIEQVYQLPKSLQLYFFGLVWVGFCNLANKNEYNIVEKIIISIFKHAKSNPHLSKQDMIWDDHALSERACVLLYIKKTINNPLFKKEIDDHLIILSKNLDILISSKKWLNNNHRVFHLCAKFCLENTHKKDYQSSLIYKEKIECFFLDLINIETGLAIEQAVSYYSFDIILLRLVSEFINRSERKFEKIDVNVLIENNSKHMSALAFPDGSLPASGDTPLGLNISKPLLKNNTVSSLWKGLEKLGHYRGSSKNNGLHFHMISHNAESAHGHNSPLHIDIWKENFGMILVDSGGPYKYGDKIRYDWFIKNKAHNTIDFSEDSYSNESTFITKKNNEHIDGIYIKNQSFLYRNLSVNDLKIKIVDTIKSDSNWILSFHFAPNIKLKKISINTYHITKNNETIEFIITRPSSNLDMKETYRTTAGGKKTLAYSIIISGCQGAHIVSTEIKNINL